MVQKISLDEALLAAERKKAMRELKSPRFKLYDLIGSKDSDSSSPESAYAWSSLESFLSTQKTVYQTLMQEACEQDYRDSKHYALAFSAYCGAARAKNEIPKSNTTELWGKHNLDFKKGDYSFQEDFLTTIVRSLNQSKNEHQVLAMISDSYDWVMYEACQIAGQISPTPMSEQIADMHIEVNGITINGFSYRNGQEPSYTGDFSKIVGNSELIAALKSGVEHILLYDKATKTNPLATLTPFPQKFMVDGRPGTGKTETLKAAANYGQQIADMHGIDFRVVNITNAIKSEFYGASTRNLREQLEEVHKGEAVYLVIIEDIDTIFYSRDELKNRPEDKSLLGELMNQLEGISTSAYGNYLLVSSTNAPLALDPALAQRLSEKTIHAAGPESPNDYIDLFKIKLGTNSVSEKDWTQIGKRCKDYDFSGRSIRNISLQVLDGCNSFEMPPDIYSKPLDEQKAILSNLIKPADAKTLGAIIEMYHSEGLRQELQEYESKVAGLTAQLQIQEEAITRCQT